MSSRPSSPMKMELNQVNPPIPPQPCQGHLACRSHLSPEVLASVHAVLTSMFTLKGSSVSSSVARACVHMHTYTHTHVHTGAHLSKHSRVSGMARTEMGMGTEDSTWAKASGTTARPTLDRQLGIPAVKISFQRSPHHR